MSTFRTFVVVMLVLVFTGHARALSPAEVTEKLDAGHHALLTWQLDDAIAIAAELERALPDVPPVQALVGLVKFHQGDYQGALALLERASEGGVDEDMLVLARTTAKETEGSVSKESAHFIIRTPKGKDEILADIALEHLEAAFEVVGTAFDYKPRHKIPVDVLHDAKGLAQVSTLTVKEIETSGTIALCKFNRLMITSPKALARGYSWLDTLSHELIHLVISEKSKNTVPIWLHEGLAKYSESLWRGQPGLALEPASENLLAKATKANKLITFDEMHPSMAKLPSQESTALAFAEVFTVVEFMHTLPKNRRDKKAGPGGYAITNELLKGLAAGKSMDQALKVATGFDLKGLQSAWMRHLRKRQFVVTPGATPKALTFIKNPRGDSRTVDESEDENALLEAKGSKEARRFVRLGNLLRARGHARAAVIEYEKARTTQRTVSPSLNNRVAQLHLELDGVVDAKKVLEESVRAVPDDPQTRVLLGRVAMKEKRFDDALSEYQRSAWENPFNPEIWAAMYQVGVEKNDDALKKRAEAAIVLLSTHARAHGRAKEKIDDAPFGVVNVSSQPWGEVVIDGLSTGIMTPVVDYRLSPGAHILRVAHPVTNEGARVRVTVKAGESTRHDLTLAPVDEATLSSWRAEERAIAADGAAGDNDADSGRARSFPNEKNAPDTE